jgi:hypothetical protein
MPKINYKIQTQLVTIWNDDGTRMPHNKSRHKGWRSWTKQDALIGNVKDAIRFSVAVRDRNTPAHWGCIVIVRRLTNSGSSSRYFSKIFEAKTGTNGLPHEEFFGVAGDYWRRELSKA